MNVNTALDKFLSDFFKRVVADKNKDHESSKEEQALYTFAPKGQDFANKLYVEGETTDWGAANDALKELNKNLTADQGTASLMYSLDSTNYDGVLEYDELAALTGNQDAQNLTSLFAEEELVDDVFSFEQMQNYAELIDLDDDWDIETTESATFGTLVTANKINIGATVVSAQDTWTTIKRFINSGDLSDIQNLLIDNIKSGNYSSADSTNTWSVDGLKKLNTSDSNNLAYAIALLLNDSDTQKANEMVEYISIYQLDDNTVHAEDTTSKGGCVIQCTDKDGNIIKEYRISNKDYATFEALMADTSKISEASTFLDSKLVSNKLDSKTPGSLGYIKTLVGDDVFANIVNVEYDDNGKVLSYKNKETGAKSYVAYNSNGAISIINVPESQTSISIDNYSSTGLLLTEQDYDTSNNIAKKKYYTHNGDGSVNSSIVDNAPKSYPTYSDGKIYFSKTNYIVAPESAEIEINTDTVTIKQGSETTIYTKTGIKVDNSNTEKIKDLLPDVDLSKYNITYNSAGKIVSLAATDTTDKKVYNISYSGETTSIASWDMGTPGSLTEVSCYEGDNTTPTQTFKYKNDSSGSFPQINGNVITFENGKTITIENTDKTVMINADGSVSVTDKDGKVTNYTSTGRTPTANDAIMLLETLESALARDFNLSKDDYNIVENGNVIKWINKQNEDDIYEICFGSSTEPTEGNFYKSDTVTIQHNITNGQDSTERLYAYDKNGNIKQSRSTTTKEDGSITYKDIRQSDRASIITSGTLNPDNTGSFSISEKNAQNKETFNVTIINNCTDVSIVKNLLKDFDSEINNAYKLQSDDEITIDQTGKITVKRGENIIEI